MTENFRSSKYLNFIINPIDNFCNLSCSYCYSRQNMRGKKIVCENLADLPILKWFPDFLSSLESLGSLEAITFTWHGGEPLLLPNKFYLKMVELRAISQAVKEEYRG